MTREFFRIFESRSAVEGEQPLTAAEISELEDDPEDFAQSITNLRDLVGVLRWSNRLYHDKGATKISDEAYDALKGELRHRKPKHSLLADVGHAPTQTARKKVHLPYPLFSLDKVKPDDGTLEPWLKSHPGPYTLSDKMDGASLELVWNGKEWTAFTRGDGVIGQDVTYVVNKLRIPPGPPNKRLVVRAETIIKVSKFPMFSRETLGKKEGYDNPRNLVTGAINKFKTLHPALGHFDVIAYEIIEPRTFTPSQSFKRLRQLGFHVPAWATSKSFTKIEIINYLTSRKKQSKYEIDGLVIEQDKVNKRPRAGTHHPDYAVAFKMTTANQMKAVKVLAVVWEESKHGLLKPRINVEPTRLSGVTIDFATGHNAYFIQHGYSLKDANKNLPERPIGPGARVLLTRSGDVIPYVMQVVKGVRMPALPRVKFTWKGVDIQATVQTDITRDKRLESFFRTVGIENIGLGVIAKLTAIGLISVGRIIRATPEDFMRATGVKERMAQKWHQSIHSKIKQVPLPSLMDASGVFGQGMGTRRCDMVIKAFPNVLTMANWDQRSLIESIATVDGFSDITARQFAIGLPKFVAWLRKIGIKPAPAKKVRRVGSKLMDEVVVFTGFRSKPLEDAIIANGGQVGSGVSRTTTILLAKNPGESSSKLQKARSMGIKIMTAADFERKYRI